MLWLKCGTGLFLSLLGWTSGPYLCEWTYDFVDSFWPHEHSSATHSYLWGGVGGAMLGAELKLVGGTAGALFFALQTLVSFFPAKRPLILLWAGSLGLLLHGTIAALLWSSAVHHLLLLTQGFPTLASALLVLIAVLTMLGRSLRREH